MNIDEFAKKSPLMQKILPQIEKFAKYNSSVLIIGESGTEKELIARIIHQLSHRSDKAFISVKCDNLAETNLDREIFGYEPGAFFDAILTRKGQVEYANGGTIYLDEILDLPPLIQLKLFYVLKDNYFMRVGGNQNINIDVRFIASSNQDLKNRVEDNDFREDLFYRISVFNLNIPPLRKRPEDIIFWAVYFINLYSQKFNKGNIFMTQDSCGLLTKYNWPGNIYEIENIIERSIIESLDGKITPDNLKINFPSNLSSLKDDIDLLFDIDLFLKKKIPLTELLEGIEELIIRNTIKESGQVQVRAAEILGITKSLLQYKMKKYNISV